MKTNFLVTVVKIFLATFLILGATFADNMVSAEYKSLQVVNNSGWPISELYITSSGNGKWGSNLLKERLENSGYVSIKYDSRYTYYDVKIVFPNGQVRTWLGNYRINLNDAWRMTILYNGKDPVGNDIFLVSKN